MSQISETTGYTTLSSRVGSLDNLRQTSQILGKYSEAKAMQRQTVQLKEGVLGKDHLDTFASIMGLAISLERQGKYIEAEAMKQ